MLLRLILLIAVSTSVCAQAQEHNADTLTAAEIAALEHGMMNSSIGYYYKADSFSRKMDSVNAGKWLMKINPYYLNWLYNDPKSTAEIYKRLKVSDSVQEAYTKIYDSALSNIKSESYVQFKKMHEEDQHIREGLIKSDDSATYAYLQKRLQYTDSVHFNYLYNYVTRNGWPSIDDGSLYACLIAIHDHAHHDLYISEIKKAIIKGQAPMEPLRLLYAWKKHRGPANLQHMLDTSNKRVFIVSSLMKQQLPSCLPRIKAVMKNNCGARFYLVLEAKDEEARSKWGQKFLSWSYGKNDVIEQLFDSIKESCPKHYSKSDKGLWNIWFLPSDGQERMVLYIVFPKK